MPAFPIARFLAALALAAAPRPATAASLYDFAFTETAAIRQAGGSGDISGRFTVEGGLITAVTGTTAFWGDIAGVIAPNSAPFTLANNAFTPASPWLSLGGVSFRTETRLINLFANGNVWTAWTDPAAGEGPARDSDGLLSVTFVPVPAPGGLAALAFGLVAIAAARRRPA